MLLRRFYDVKLAQASYLIGCPASGEALVVDPNRRLGQYLEAAAAEGLRIRHVTETHIHADFVSGSRELAAATGARLYLSAEGGPVWQYGYAREAGATLLRDGDRIDIGRVRVEVRHTPGHTPEHLTFLVTDTAVTDRPIGACTGDFIFAGDVGRPDLLEKAANDAGAAEREARRLFTSLQGFADLSDWLQLWPGHGAGSACGKALGAVPQTTLGYERLVNWAFAARDQAAFVREALRGQPEPPRYFGEMKRINRDGPRVLERSAPPSRLPGGALSPLLAAGGSVIDIRPAAAFAARHVPGTINIPYDRSFTTWAGWLLPYDRDFHLLVGDLDVRGMGDVIADLATIGLDRLAGYFGGDAVDVWEASGGALGTVPQWTPADLARHQGDPDTAVVDVRWASEWAAGHLPGVSNVPVPELLTRLAALPDAPTLVLLCQGGGRSSIAASLLAAAGRANVVNLAGGYRAWTTAGLPVVAEGD